MTRDFLIRLGSTFLSTLIGFALGVRWTVVRYRRALQAVEDAFLAERRKRANGNGSK